ncbi:MAG: MltA domain-containing protein [Sedimentisphaerales bacterium]|jgi:membrane-bound lytic murein transglycosylase A
MRKRILLAVSCLIVVFSGCKSPPAKSQKAYDRPLPPGQLALRKITNPAEIPDFSAACRDLAGLKTAVHRSINYLQKPSSRQFYPVGEITHDTALESLKSFAQMLDSGMTGAELNLAIRQKFDVYTSIGCDDQGTVLFTGYYTPIFDGSMQRTERFCYPLYKPPDDLVKAPDGEILGRRMPDGQITAYPSRAVIEGARMLRGKELIWLSDPFEAYIAHVQGSAKLRLPNSKVTTVGYAASNGREYQSVAEALVNDGKIPADHISLASMIDYFKRHKDQVSTYIRRNARYVFFQKQEDGSPRGCLNEPVTAYRTIATDKSIFPRGSLTFITTTLPHAVGGRAVSVPYSGFALDQDAGGAIRAPGRSDVYMGVGDVAGELAGQTYQEGRLYYLFLKQTTDGRNRYAQGNP